MESRFDIRGENLYLLPEEPPDTKKLKVLMNKVLLVQMKLQKCEIKIHIFFAFIF